MVISVFDRVENIVGKGENADYQHFLLFPQCFQNSSFSSHQKLELFGKGLNKIYYLVHVLHLISSNTAIMKNNSPSAPSTIRFQAIISKENGLTYTSVLNLAKIMVFTSLAIRSNKPPARAYCGKISITFLAVSTLSRKSWK